MTNIKNCNFDQKIEMGSAFEAIAMAIQCQATANEANSEALLELAKKMNGDKISIMQITDESAKDK